MTRKEDRDDPKSPADSRAAFVRLTHEIEAVEHIGRQNPVVGRRKTITEQLIAAGGNSERELLPLLDDPSLAVRYTVTPLSTAYQRKHVAIVTKTSFRDGRAWFRAISPWGWRAEIVRFGYSCSSTSISAQGGQFTS